MRIKAQENEKRQDHSCLFPYSISGRSSPMKNTATVLLCSLGVGVCIWLFDAVAVLAVKTLIGVFAG